MIPILQHLIFWSVYLSFTIAGAKICGKNTMNHQIYLSFCQVILFYINYKLLLPRLFERKKIPEYFIIIILIIVLTAWLNEKFLSINNQYINGICQEMKIAAGYSPQPDPDWPPGILMPERVILGSLFVLFFSSVFYFSQAQKEQEKRELMLLNNVRQLELLALKAQINPHFIFNALNNLYTLSVIKSDQTPSGIKRLSDILCYVLYDCSKEKVQVEREVEYINNYLNLVRLKDDQPDRIVFEHDVPYFCLVAPMLFLPFIENSFKHGNIGYTQNGWVYIALRVDHDRLAFTCENTISQKKISKDKVGGIGIRNVKSRLREIYNNNYDLHFYQDEKTYKVKLTLPLECVKRNQII